jgi:uncharacterized protein (DUF952 family)
MSYFPDLSTQAFIWCGEPVRAVGWLDDRHDFSRGPTPDAALERLKRHIAERFSYSAFAGVHDCELCNGATNGANLFVPTPEVVYIAPAMIVHYIEVHAYRPPGEFLDALAACPEQASPAYMQLLAPYFPIFRIPTPDPLPTPEHQLRLSKLVADALDDIWIYCRQGKTQEAGDLAAACATVAGRCHGWDLWYRFVFSQAVGNGRSESPLLNRYFERYEAIFGEDTDPERTAQFQVQADPYIYLLDSSENFEEALRTGTFVRKDLDEDGFIHASPADQLTRVANKFYRQVKHLRCAVVEKAKVRSEVKYEPATGGLYPHIYGPLNMDAVVRMIELTPDAEGRYEIDPAKLDVEETTE